MISNPKTNILASKYKSPQGAIIDLTATRMDYDNQLNREKATPGPMEYSEGVEQRSMKTVKKSYGNTVFEKSSKSSYFDRDKKRTQAIPGPGSYRI
jgi:hypothetical protein